jgi:hypothetical protein
MSLALKQQLLAAKKIIAERRNQRGIETWTATQVGKGRFKPLKISADAVVQLAIQLAVHEVTGETPATFEPVQLRHFAGGRMDFIVPVTAESLSAVAALRDPRANKYHVAQRVRHAAKEHQRLVLRTKNGRGLIAHLLALNAIQAKDASHNGTHSWHRAVLSRLDKACRRGFVKTCWPPTVPAAPASPPSAPSGRGPIC